MTLTVALLTCDRFDLTRRTVESLCTHNDVSAWSLVHADDHSRDERIGEYVRSRGFRTVAANCGERVGVTKMTAAMFRGIEGPDDTPILYLQDDWESVGSVPFGVVRHCLHRNVGWVRLFYARHNRSAMRAIPVETVGRQRFSIGPLGYSDQPHVTFLGLARRIFRGAHTEGGVANNAKATGMDAAVLHPSIMTHIGRNHPAPGSRHGIPKRLRHLYLTSDGIIQ